MLMILIIHSLLYGSLQLDYQTMKKKSPILMLTKLDQKLVLNKTLSSQSDKSRFHHVFFWNL